MSNADLSSYTVPKNNKGTIALVFGVLSIITSLVSIGFIFGVIGFIVGLIGLKQIKQYNQTGKRKAVVGVACSLVGIIISISLAITTGSLLLN